MDAFFFSGSHSAKLDEKNRFVLPQSMRYGLVEGGKLEFTLALGLGGCLTIYRKSDIERIVNRFRSKINEAKYQKFFTLFFSTMHHTSCDKVGRVLLPPLLKTGVGIKNEIIIAGVLNKIEIWPKEKYENDLLKFLEGKDPENLLKDLLDEAFSIANETQNEQANDPIPVS
ncbi:MAG: hypothetical protein WDZ28_00320 [Simkaniaceae bacterium]